MGLVFPSGSIAGEVAMSRQVFLLVQGGSEPDGLAQDRCGIIGGLRTRRGCTAGLWC